MRRSIEDNFRIEWVFVRVINTRKVLDLATARLGIDTFGVPVLAYFQRRIKKDLDGPVTSYNVPHIIASRAIGTDGHASMSDNFRGDEADAADVDSRGPLC